MHGCSNGVVGADALGGPRDTSKNNANIHGDYVK